MTNKGVTTEYRLQKSFLPYIGEHVNNTTRYVLSLELCFPRIRIHPQRHTASKNVY